MNRFPCCRFDMPEVDLSETSVENMAPLDNEGWVKNVVDLTRFKRIDRNRTNRLKFVATF